MADCEARRLASQEYRCLACGLRWDAGDPAPPLCPRKIAALAATNDSLAAAEAKSQINAAVASAHNVLAKNGMLPPVVSLQGSAIMGGKPVARASLVDRLAALCENMRAGVLTTKEAADMLEDLTVEVGLRLPG